MWTRTRELAEAEPTERVLRLLSRVPRATTVICPGQNVNSAAAGLRSC